LNCYVFQGCDTVFPRICGTTALEDLLLHLKRSGIKEVHTFDTPFEEVRERLGSPWLAAWSGMITRQSPMELAARAGAYPGGNAASLSCSGEPWRHTTVLTGPEGEITRREKNPPPENAETNLCFSGLVLVREEGFDPVNPLEDSRAFHIPGYWMEPRDRESYLLACHHILSGDVVPWHGPGGGKPPSHCLVKGTLWLGKGCVIGEGCTLENCVIMDGAAVGFGSQLKNCLVNPGAVVKPGTVMNDKYLTLLGE